MFAKGSISRQAQPWASTARCPLGSLIKTRGYGSKMRGWLSAGAETVVVSLWKVNDGSMSLRMDTYYRNLLAGLGHSAAMREAMLELRTSQPHPHDWAPCIVVGSDATLFNITSAESQPPRK